MPVYQLHVAVALSIALLGSAALYAFQSTTTKAVPVFYQGVMLGHAVLDPLSIQPGSNTVPTEFRYAPKDANDTTAQSFITDFLQSSKELDLTINGDANSSPFASLVPAMEGLQMMTTDLKGACRAP